MLLVAVACDVTAINWQLMHKIFSFENQTHLSRECAGILKFVKLLPATSVLGFDSYKFNKPCVF